MGRKPGKIETAPPADPFDGEATPDDVDAFESIDRLADELPGGAAACTVIVYKRSPDGQRIVRCKRFPLDKFQVDDLPALFGGGDFSLRVIDSQGRHHRSFKVSFEPSILPDRVVAAAAPAPAAVIPAAGVSPTDARLNSLEAALRESERRHTAFLETLVTSGLKGGGPGPGDQIALFRQLLEMMREVSAPRTPAAEMGEVMRTALEVVKEASSGGGGEPGEGGDIIMRTLESFLPRFIDTLTARPRPLPAGARPAQPARAPAANAPGRVPEGAAPAAAPSVSAALPPEWAAYEFMREHVQQFVAMAGRKVEPELVGQLCYQHVDDKHLNDLEAFVRLGEGERHTILSQLDARLVAYLPYLDRVAESILEEFDNEHGGDSVPAQS